MIEFQHVNNVWEIVTQKKNDAKPKEIGNLRKIGNEWNFMTKSITLAFTPEELDTLSGHVHYLIMMDRMEEQKHGIAKN